MLSIIGASGALVGIRAATTAWLLSGEPMKATQEVEGNEFCLD